MDIIGKIIKIILECGILIGLLYVAYFGIVGTFFTANLVFEIISGKEFEYMSFGIILLCIFAVTMAFSGVGLSYHMIKNIITDTKKLIKKGEKDVN